MKRFLFILAALTFAATASRAQELPQLPNDPETRVGKLDNGLTYYIRHNDKPEKRAEFYLATNAGALQEGEGQDGLAHFLEHMCFNGTKNFPGKGILDWLQSIGASFGGNVNASTGVEQTIYLLNNIPLVRPTVVDSCILIMHDYSHFVTCDPVEIDKERGVILEEKRTRNTADWRFFERSAKFIYGDTKYAITNIIGSEENLRNFKPESLTSFYHKWYIPNNQALIVVGDIDVDEIESKIKSTFADIPALENPAVKEDIVIPENKEPIIGILTDPEASSNNFEVVWKKPAHPEYLNSTNVGLVTDLLEDIISLAVNERLDDAAAKPDAVFSHAKMGFGKVCETMECFEAEVGFKDGNGLASLEKVLMEAEKLRRFGLSDGEIERAKAELLSVYETRANKADTRKNAEFVRPLINNFFDNHAFMDPKVENEYVKAILPQITADVINQIAAQAVTDENVVVLYTGSSKNVNPTPTEDQVKEVLAKVRNAEIERPAGEEIPTEFINPASLKGSKARRSREYLYGSEKFTLSNGMDVILLPTDYEKDKVLFGVIRKGGMDLISDEDIPSFETNLWTLYKNNTGVAGFPATTVSKMLSGKQVSVAPSISDGYACISGRSTSKDLETAFQLAYLYFAEPRFDVDEYNIGINQLNAVLPNFTSTPNYQLLKAYNGGLFSNPDRHPVISDDVIAKSNLSTLEDNYRKLFSDAAGTTLIVVGDFDKAEVKAYAQKYMGSISKGRKAAQWQYRADGYREGSNTIDFRTAMQTPKTTVYRVYSLPCEPDINKEVAYEAVAYILNMTYTDTLREDEGGTYGASVKAEASHEPNPYFSMFVAFETNDKDADKLRRLASQGLEDLAKNGPDPTKYDMTVKNFEKNIPEAKLNNGYWLNAIANDVIYGREFVDSYSAAVADLTPEKVRSAAAELLEKGNFGEIVMRPEIAE